MELEFTDAPTSFLQTASQLKSENNGQHKLRLRNDKIYSELVELAARNDTKVSVHKKGSGVWYCVENMGITISLVNG